jgi:integrase
MASIRKRTWSTKTGEKSAWIVAYLHKDKDGKLKQHIRTFATKKAAAEWRATMTVERQRGIHVPATTSITIAEAGARWIEGAQNDGLEASTVVGYGQYLKYHITPFIGDFRLADLSAASIEDFRNELRREGRSPAMVKKVITALGSIITHAMSLGLASRNPVREAAQYGRRRARLSARHQKRLEVGIDIPTKEELAAILQAAAGRWRPLIWTTVFTGLRASEIRGLRWEDVDLKAATLQVRQRADRWNRIGSPKSAASQREVPLTPKLVGILKEWKLACPKGPQELVFPDDDGTVVSLTVIRRQALGKTQIAAGLSRDAINPKYAMHSFRHAAASLLIESGKFTAKEIQALLGHSSIQMTFDTYGHLFRDPETTQKKMAALEAQLVG